MSIKNNKWSSTKQGNDKLNAAFMGKAPEEEI